MNKVLYVSAFLPDNNGTHAGARAAMSNLNRLLSEYVNVDVLVCTTEKIDPEDTNYVIIRQNKIRYIFGLIIYAKYLSLNDLMVSSVLHTRINVSFVKALKEMISMNSYDYIFIDFTQAVMPVLIALKQSNISVHLSCILHDIYVQKYLRKNDLLSKIKYGFIARSEYEMLSCIKNVILLNKKDESIVKNMYLKYETCVYSYEPPDWVVNVKKDDCQKSKKLLIYGNFERKENSESALIFIHDIFPEILKEYPEYQLQLLGYGSVELKNKNRFSASVVALGFINNPAQIFSESLCSIAPLISGAGIKYKVLDSLAAGLPVIGTSIAFEGIEKNNMMYECDIKDMAKCIKDYIAKNKEYIR